MYFALGTVIAVVARGVDGRIGCHKSATLGSFYYVADRETCWVDTMNTRFGKGESLMETCGTVGYGWVSCCSVGVGYTMCSPRCVGTDAHSDVLVWVQPTPLHSPKYR